MTDKRWLKLVRILYEAQRDVPLGEIAAKLGLSDRTVKTIISQNEGACETYGLALSRTLKGTYLLTVKNAETFAKIFSEGVEGRPQDGTVAVNDKLSRINYMIYRLLAQDGYLRIEDLAEEMYVSRATLDRLMPELKETVQEYNLQVFSRPKYGICLDGSEINKRICYAHHVKNGNMGNANEVAMKVQDILLTVIRSHDLVLSDINFYNLVQHCVIAIRRIATGNELNEKQDISFADSAPVEAAAAGEIVDRFEKEFQISIPDAEEQYIVMHLMGKRVLKESQAINPEVFLCIEDIFEEIQRQKGIDLGADMELKTALALHIQPMLLRLRFGLKQENPILTEIKREMTQGYELALCAADVLYREYGHRVNEDEAGYLALHFAVALERQGEAADEKKILVVCASGRGTAKLIRHRLLNRYHFKEENLILTSALLLGEQNFSDVLCILSTVPLLKDYPVPTVLIDMSMNRQSVERIDQFLKSVGGEGEEARGAGRLDMERPDGGVGLSRFLRERLIFADVKLESREEILDFLCEATVDCLDLQPDFKEQVLKREELSSTEVGNQLALPHPYEYAGTEPIVCFLSLKKPVRWKYSPVRLVILMALPMGDSKEAELLSDTITGLAGDLGAIKRLLTRLDKDTIGEVVFGGNGR